MSGLIDSDIRRLTYKLLQVCRISPGVYSTRVKGAETDMKGNKNVSTEPQIA